MRRSSADASTPSPTRNPVASSKSWPGVRIVTATRCAGRPGHASRISSGSSVASRSSCRSTVGAPSGSAGAGAVTSCTRTRLLGPGRRVRLMPPAYIWAMRRRPRERSARQDDWTSELSSSLALAGFLFFVLVGFTMLAMAPLASLDTYLSLGAPPPAWVSTLHLVDRVGQRAVCVPVLAAVTYLCCRHQRSWRPAWVVAAAVFALNLAVLILKLALGRGQAGTDPAFFVGGMAYPSGHTANIVLVYGLVAYLLSRYRRVPQRVRGGAVVRRRRAGRDDGDDVAAAELALVRRPRRGAAGRRGAAPDHGRGGHRAAADRAAAEPSRRAAPAVVGASTVVRRRSARTTQDAS